MKPLNLCVTCKGKGMCGKPCPIVAKAFTAKKIKPGSTLFGSSPPAVFVGRYGYPDVKAGIMAPMSSDSESWKLNDPVFWAKEKLAITDLIEMRSSLVNSKFSANVKRPGKTLDVFTDLTMAERPADVELKLGRLKVDMEFSGFHAPIGPSAILKKARLAENPRIPAKVDSIVSERIDAKDAMVELYSKGLDVSYLTRLLSAGLLGKSKKMVPTRWGITATDDTLSKHMLEEIRHYAEIDSWEIYHNRYLDNDYHVVLFPRKWAFEQIEAYSESVWGSAVVKDHEFYHGRKNYASNVTGAYYAARFAICEHLLSRKRQAAALVVRTVGKGYFAPLGVWQVRENIREAMRAKPLKFSDKELALFYLKANSRLKERAQSESSLLYEWDHQKTLLNFSKL